MRRLFTRVVVPLSLLVSGAALLPVSALAQPSDQPSDQPTDLSSVTTSPTGSPSDGATTPSAPQTSAAPSTGASSPAAPSRRALVESSTGTPTVSPTTSPTTDPTLTTTITSRPRRTSVDRAPRFTFRANRPGVQFRCRLTGPGHSGSAFHECPASGGTATTTTGQKSYSTLAAARKKYTFTVRAYVPAVAADPGPPEVAATPEVQGRSDAYGWRIYSVYRLSSFAPGTGASFNTPMGGYSSQRRNLTRVIRTINAMPGYGTHGGPCPTTPSLYPSTIRISAYSLYDGKFSSALRAANRRCISVQVLMNNHLTPATDYPWGQLERALGNRVYSHGHARRSFAHRCHYGCRGYGVLHTKMYLFDSNIASPMAYRNKIRNTTMVGSSNITSNASKVQWNDLYAIRGNAKVHHDYLAMFNRMKRGHKSGHLYRYSEGRYSSVFWPQGHSRDPYKSWLGGVHCFGARGGSGIGGRTVVYINMHAWFGTRGLSLARQVRGLYNRGCYVRVLYGFMSYKVFKILHGGAGSRMSVRRTLFSHDGRTGYLYSHFKNINISGNYGGDSSTWLVSTGSNNFTNEGTHFDEVALRIKSRAAYNSYVRHFKYISRRKSSAIYANYSEPTGGGRAP